MSTLKNLRIKTRLPSIALSEMDSFSNIVEERVKNLKTIQFTDLVPHITKVYSNILQEKEPQYFMSSMWESISLFLYQVDKLGGLKVKFGTIKIRVLGTLDGSVMTDVGRQTFAAMYLTLYDPEIFDPKVKHLFEKPLPYIFGFFPETNLNSKKIYSTIGKEKARLESFPFKLRENLEFKYQGNTYY